MVGTFLSSTPQPHPNVPSPRGERDRERGKDEVVIIVKSTCNCPEPPGKRASFIRLPNEECSWYINETKTTFIIFGISVTVSKTSPYADTIQLPLNDCFALFERLPDAVLIVASDGGIQDCNPAALNFFQITKNELKTANIAEFHVDPKECRERLGGLDERGLIHDAPTTVIDRNKKKKHCLTTIVGLPAATEKGEPVFCVFYRGIDRPDRNRDVLEKRDVRHRQVLEATPDPVLVRDTNGRVLYLNPAFTRVFGWTLAECRNKRIHFNLDDESGDSHSLFERLQRGGIFSGVETQRYNKAGDLVDVSISGAVFMEANGKPRGSIITLQDITERRRKDEELRFVAYHDTLTGLPNRKSFYMRLDDLLQHSSRRRSDRTWALMFLDLDKFKQVNDSLGHDIGDWLLKSVAERLKGCLRETDHLFRLGGDEFTIILTNLGRDIDVANVTRKILAAIKQPFVFNGQEIFTSTSIGISVFPNDGWDLEGLVKNADMAMYTAKNSGGNDYRFFTEEMNSKALHRMKMENSLRKALEHGELLLYYQPLVDRGNRIVGMEALLRWQHPELGLIMPADFIRISEETGIIVPMGRWVLETACAQAKRWHDMGFDDLFISVNLTARQLNEPDFEQMVLEVLEKSGLPTQSLNLEVTESNMIQDPDTCISKMKNLRDKGITFSIDDFGTGYSSLVYLKRFPIDSLKIDRSFISESMKNKGDREIVKTIIGMAHNLNIGATAEGVETEAQKDFLILHGCNTLQGFYFATPLPGEQFGDLLKRQNVVRKSDK